MIDRFLTWLLGPKCELHCGERVFAGDKAKHENLEHAGDPRLS